VYLLCTFRLADSIPQDVLDRWLYERERSMKALESKARRKPSRAEQQQIEERFGTQLQSYLDRGFGSCVLRNRSCATIVANALEHFHGSRVNTGDYVIMPNHVHVLLTPWPGYVLERVLRSIKGFAAKEINRLIGSSGTLWQSGSYDRIVRDWEHLRSAQEYIRENPRKAHLDPAGCFVAEASYVQG
jgi:REP element-mobilizing transposase RayT